MPSIVYQTNKKTGQKYAYESCSYWDKTKQSPRSKRKYLGRVDPETGEIIKSSRKRKSVTAGNMEDAEQVSLLQEELQKMEEEIASLRKELTEMTDRYNKTTSALKKIRDLTDPDKIS